MVQRSAEGDVLIECWPDIIQVLTGNWMGFGSRAFSAGLLSASEYHAICAEQSSDHSKANRVMEEIRIDITNQSTPERITEKFNIFLQLLLEMRLDAMTQRLLHELSKKKPSYVSPLPAPQEENLCSDAWKQKQKHLLKVYMVSGLATLSSIVGDVLAIHIKRENFQDDNFYYFKAVSVFVCLIISYYCYIGQKRFDHDLLRIGLTCGCGACIGWSFDSVLFYVTNSKSVDFWPLYYFIGTLTIYICFGVTVYFKLRIYNRLDARTFGMALSAVAIFLISLILWYCVDRKDHQIKVYLFFFTFGYCLSLDSKEIEKEFENGSKNYVHHSFLLFMNVISIIAVLWKLPLHIQEKFQLKGFLPSFKVDAENGSGAA